jgi:eukaryotic-like serine/threonine-protein kinase
MSSLQRCSECGAEISAARQEGLCTRCLLELGLKAELEKGNEPALNLQLPTRFGDYELLEEIARGGMGLVYRAQQISLDRVVAVKLLLAGAFSSPENVKRFRVEASAAASLQHRNIVTIHEVGVHQGQHYLVMDYADGPSLAKRVANGPLPPKTAAAYLKIVAEAVHFAHEHGILHRDLKPSNILVDAKEQPRVTDFGLAKKFEGDSELTVSGQLVGSPSYLPPEQAAARRGKVSRRSDVYGLGATFYHLLTGRAPFQAATIPETLEQVLNTEPVAPRLLNPAVPRDLETICLKCLEKEPAKRYPTAQALAEELARFLNGQPVVARPVGALGKAWRWCRRQPVRAGLIGAVLFVSGLGLGGVLWEWRAAQRSAKAELQQRRRADEQTRVAKASALLARRNEYAADMKEVQRKLEDSDLSGALEVLNRYRPGTSAPSTINHEPSTDLRGWEWRYLWARCQSEESFTLCQYLNAVTALGFLRDGKCLALRLPNGKIVLWDTASRKPLTELAGAGRYKALACSNDGNLLAWGNTELLGSPVVSVRAVSIHSVTTPAPSGLSTLNSELSTDLRLPLTAQLVSVGFSPDARQIATLADDGTVSVWDLATKALAINFVVAAVDPLVWRSQRDRPTRARLFGDHHGCVVFSPDGRWLAVGEARPRIQLLERATGKLIPIPMTGAADGISALAFSPDGRWLAAGCGAQDNAVHIWDVAAKRELTPLHGHSGWIVALAFSPDGQTLATAGSDQTLRLWDVAKPALRRKFQGHTDELWAVGWSPDGRYVITGGRDGSVRYWHPASKPTAAFRVLPEKISFWGPAFLPDSRTFLAANFPDGGVVQWDAATGERVGLLTFLGTNHTSVDLSGDGRWLALGDAMGHVRVWDLPARCLVTNLVVATPGYVFAAIFSPGGTVLNCGVSRPDGRLVPTFWTVPGWRELKQPDTNYLGCTDAAFPPNETMFGVGYRNGTAAWWDIFTGRRVAFFDSRYAGGVQVAFSMDGKWFATAGEDGPVTLWDTATRKPRPIPRGHRNGPHDLVFSPDGKRLAASDSTRTGSVKLWDVETGSDVATLPGEPSWSCHIGFSPDGSTLFAASIEGTTLLWRAPSWEEIDAAETKQQEP